MGRLVRGGPLSAALIKGLYFFAPFRIEDAQSVLYPPKGGILAKRNGVTVYTAEDFIPPKGVLYRRRFNPPEGGMQPP